MCVWPVKAGGQDSAWQSGTGKTEQTVIIFNEANVWLLIVCSISEL